MSTFEPRTAVVTIFQGDYLDRIRFVEQKYKAAVEAEKTAPTRVLSDVPESAKLADEHAALVAEAEEAALQITVRALGRKAWRALVADHPARPDHPADEVVGVNEDTFKDALVPASIVAPELSADELDRFSDAQFDSIYYTAFGLNRAPQSDPKALPVSQTSPASDAT